MGMTVYLDAEVYCTNDKKIVQDNLDVFGKYSSKIESIIFSFAKWRKFKGVNDIILRGFEADDGYSRYMEKEDVEELRDISKKILADKSSAKTLMPGDEYDDCFFASLEEVVNNINELLDFVDEIEQTGKSVSIKCSYDC